MSETIVMEGEYLPNKTPGHTEPPPGDEMSTVPPSPSPGISTDPDETLDMLQNIRIQMLLQGAKPDKPTLGLMKQITDTATAQLRLKVDKGVGDNIAQTAQLFAAVLAQSHENPFRAGPGNQNTGATRTLSLNQLPPELEIVEGETSTVMPTITYEEIMPDD